jgi:pyruvate/2-oxoglutarate dehydrogenase complex dihydrolipoamide acyltransferase (E2) component
VADEEYVSFENALRELQISADQLKRLVSEGEIRAIRGEHNTMRFRKDEIDRLKQDTGKTLQFTEASSETLTDDLLFDEADDKDAEEGASTVQMKPSAPAPKAAPKPPPPKPAAKPAAAARPMSPKPSPESRPVTPVRRTTSRSAPRAGVVADPSGIGMGSVIALVACALVMLFTTFVLLDIAEDKVTSVTEGLAGAATPKELKGG